MNESSGVSFHFGYKFSRLERDGSPVFNVHGREETVHTHCVFGADGAYSAVRAAIAKMGRYNFSQQFIDHGYKELSIPPLHDRNGDAMFALSRHEALHIWPRHDFMLIALPNSDQSFTCTLFAPFTILNGLKDADAVTAFVRFHFGDAEHLLDRSYARDWFATPVSPLVTVRFGPQWNWMDKAVVIGDAAHAVCPFYGQGMNAGFEDVLVLNEVMRHYPDPSSPSHINLALVLEEYSRLRQPAADALADLSLNNYIEMRSKTASTWFRFRKRIEHHLHDLMPNSWIPLYTMVSFTRIPYHEAMSRDRRQQRLLSLGIAVTAVGIASLALSLTPTAIRLYKSYSS